MSSKSKKGSVTKRKNSVSASGSAIDAGTLRLFAENSSDAFFILHSDEVRYANPSIKKIFGCEAEEFETYRINKILSFFYPFDREKVFTDLQKCSRGGGELRNITCRVIHIGGALKWISLSAHPIHSEDEVSTLLIILTDRTKEKDAEEALRESEKKFSNAFDHAAFGMAIVSVDGKYIKANKSLVKLLGYSENRLLEMNSIETIHVEDRETYLKILTELIARRRDYGWMEKRLIRKDKRTIWVLDSTTIVRDDENIPLYFISHIQDVTEQKYAEEVFKSINKELEARVKSRSRELKELIEQSPYAIGIFKGSGTIIEHNDAWQTLFGSVSGYEENTWNIFNLNILVRNGYIPQVKNLISEGGKIKTNPLVFSGMNIKGGSNEQRILIFHIYTISGSMDKGFRLVVMVEDVTESETKENISSELEMQRRHSAAIIEVLERERKRISQELHDVIGQQLLVAKLNLEFYIKHISPSDVKLQETKNKIIDMSKEIRGIIHSLHPAEIDKYGLIDAIELLSHHFNQDSGIDCETLFNGDARFVAKKNEVHIYRIVQEALNNISKHSRASQVAVNIIFDKDKVIGSVQDNGIGFDLNKSKAASASAEGFGIIGMSERTRILGGTLKINSIKDKGTEIVFEIPNREFIYE